MDGVLLIDKPSGPTSHDVVARLRSTSGERSIGHTGTLDPRATGLLPLVLGRATRLAKFLSGGHKTYEATIRLGFSTDTDDADGLAIGGASTTLPDDAGIARALDAFRGAFEQVPPNVSAKRVGGEKAYDMARRDQPMELKPVTVTVHALDLLGRDADLVTIRVCATAGFYVRALARDLGRQLGCGAHLFALRRTHSGTFDLANAISLEAAERLGRDIASHLVTPADALSELPAVSVTDVGFKRVAHGNPIGPEHLAGRWVPPSTLGMRVRVMGPEGRLLALAESRGGALHPVVVLG